MAVVLQPIVLCHVYSEVYALEVYTKENFPDTGTRLNACGNCVFAFDIFSMAYKPEIIYSCE